MMSIIHGSSTTAYCHAAETSATAIVASGNVAAMAESYFQEAVSANDKRGKLAVIDRAVKELEGVAGKGSSAVILFTRWGEMERKTSAPDRQLPYLEEMVRLHGEVFGDKSLSAVMLECMYADVLKQTGDYGNAGDAYLRAAKICDAAGGVWSDIMKIQLLYGVSDVLSHKGSFSEAIELLEEALVILDNKTQGFLPEPKRRERRIQLMVQISHAWLQTGNLKKALEYNSMAMNRYLGFDQTAKAGMKETEYTLYLNRAEIEAEMGNYYEALKSVNKAIETILNTYYSLYNQAYVNALYVKADICLAGQRMDRAHKYDDPKKLCLEALAIVKDHLTPNVDNYYQAVLNCIVGDTTKSRYGTYYKMITMMEPLMATLKGSGSKRHMEVLALKAGLEARIGKYREAIETDLKAYEGIRKIMGEESPVTLEHLNTAIAYHELAANAGYTGDVDAGIRKYLPEGIRLYRRTIRNMFTGMTSRERGHFMTRLRPEVNMYHRIVMEHGAGELDGEGYDVALTEKGALLASEMELDRIVREQSDTVTIRFYDNIKELRRQAAQQRAMPISQRTMNADSLEYFASEIERVFVGISADYGDFTRRLGVSWRDVRDGLAADELAVEFVAYHGRDVLDTVPSTVYMAYVIGKDMEKPKAVRLFNAEDLARVRRQQYYTTGRLTEMIWEPLHDYVTGKKRIWFTPDGELYSIAIENLPGDVMEGKEFRRLSSTREIALQSSSNKASKGDAVLYGGLKYHSEESEGKAIRNMTNVPGYLPGTLAEVNEIGHILRSADIGTEIFTADKGTESSIRNLSGQGVSILHIATHGFYLPTMEQQQVINPVPGGDGLGLLGRSIENEIMNRSGLLMSGVGRLVKSRVLDDDDDGILTAAEISRLDLQGMELTVLSACQTGLGDVSGDGVFGLQRGFKKAGAGTLLMSLWKVDDKATEMLMTQFYKGIAAGKSKYEALSDAQKYVREYRADRNGMKVQIYAHPVYWAGFILLDAK